MAEPYSSKFHFTYSNELVSCGPCQPQFSRNALIHNRFFKAPIVWTVSGGGLVLTSAAGEKGRSSYGQDQVVTGLSAVIATEFYTNLYQDGAFADNDCFFRQYAMSMKIDPLLYNLDDTSGSPTLGQLTVQTPNNNGNSVTTEVVEVIGRLLREAMRAKLIQRNSACEFDLGRPVTAAYPGAGGTHTDWLGTGLSNVDGQELASAICHPGNTGSKRPIIVMEQSVPVVVTLAAGSPVITLEGQKLVSFVEFRAEGEDVYSAAPA